jgi:hypothetical protein
MNIKRSLVLTIGALLALSLALAGTANADKAFTMSGQWYMNRGPLVDIPQNGGPVACFGGSLQTGCLNFFKQANGGIPGSTGVTAMNAGPASFTIPPAAFGQALGSQRYPLPIAVTVIQLATAFTAQGPANPTQAAGAVPTFLAEQPAVFGKNAFSNDPGQAGRLAPDFAWCPGVGGPACPSGLAATPAAVQGIIRYTAGANAFGGTMAMMLKGGGATSIVGGTIMLPTAGAGLSTTQLIAHLPIQNGTTFGNPQVGGNGYGFSNMITLGSAPLFIGYMTNMSRPTPTPIFGNTGGLITSTGPPLLTTMGSGVYISTDMNINWGMPWTTGTISVMNTELTPMNQGTTTLTAMGSDNRTNAGKGSITMVAGATSTRTQSGMDFAALEVVVMNFDDGNPAPSMGPAGLATVALLIALSAGYAIRGRFASAS